MTLFLLLWLTACATGQEPNRDAGQSDGEDALLEVSNAWARPAKVMAMDDADQENEMPLRGMTSAIYLTIKNMSEQDDRLDNVQIEEIANVAELHKTTIDEHDVMKMQQVEGGIPIPAGEEVELKPGDYHIMLIDVQQDLKAGDQFKAKLHFEKAGEVTVEVEVRESNE